LPHRIGPFNPATPAHAGIFDREIKQLQRGINRLTSTTVNLSTPLSPDSKSEIAGLTILQQDGSRCFLPVRGHKAGRFFDAFGVLRFLDRVRTDIGKQSVGRIEPKA
jgi:hypothetical protein